MIGTESFKVCALKKLKFDWSSTNSSFCIENIGGYAFSQCHKLVEVNLSSTATKKSLIYP